MRHNENTAWSCRQSVAVFAVPETDQTKTRIVAAAAAVVVVRRSVPLLLLLLVAVVAFVVEHHTQHTTDSVDEHCHHDADKKNGHSVGIQRLSQQHPS